jgi:hypothetical protein
MYRSDRAGRQEFCKYAQPIAVDDAGIREALFCEPSGNVVGIFRGDFNSQEVMITLFDSGLRKKQSLPAADFDFQRCRARKQPLCIPRPRQLLERQKMARQVERRINFTKRTTRHEYRGAAKRNEHGCQKRTHHHRVLS